MSAQTHRRPGRRSVLAVAPLAAFAVFAAGCSGGSTGTDGAGGTAAGAGSASSAASPPASPPATSPSASTSSGSSTGTASGATVAVATNDKLGQILVDSDGRTLYLFEKDSGGMSTCFDACAQVWPPFTTDGEPQAGQGATGSLVSTTARKDGATQVVYNGHPLYYYAPDKQPGDTFGQGLDQFGAEWYVLSPQGDKVENGGS